MTGSFSKKLTLWPKFGTVFSKVWQTEFEIKHLKPGSLSKYLGISENKKLTKVYGTRDRGKENILGLWLSGLLFHRQSWGCHIKALLLWTSFYAAEVLLFQTSMARKHVPSLLKVNCSTFRGRNQLNPYRRQRPHVESKALQSGACLASDEDGRPL